MGIFEKEYNAIINEQKENNQQTQGAKVALGPSINCLLKANSDGSGFEIKIEGTFKSGDDFDKTLATIKSCWKRIDIDAGK